MSPVGKPERDSKSRGRSNGNRKPTDCLFRHHQSLARKLARETCLLRAALATFRRSFSLNLYPGANFTNTQTIAQRTKKERIPRAHSGAILNPKISIVPSQFREKKTASFMTEGVTIAMTLIRCQTLMSRPHVSGLRSPASDGA